MQAKAHDGISPLSPLGTAEYEDSTKLNRLLPDWRQDSCYSSISAETRLSPSASFREQQPLHPSHQACERAALLGQIYGHVECLFLRKQHGLTCSIWALALSSTESGSCGAAGSARLAMDRCTRLCSMALFNSLMRCLLSVTCTTTDRTVITGMHCLQTAWSCMCIRTA